MASSVSYYAKNLFKSSYGKDRPDFFIWYPKGTSASEKKLLHKLDFFSKFFCIPGPRCTTINEYTCISPLVWMSGLLHKVA